jgi:hypothetical protein
MHIGFQVTTLEEFRQHPSLAFAYLLKLPLASKEKGLSTGWQDHKIAGLISRKIGATGINSLFIAQSLYWIQSRCLARRIPTGSDANSGGERKCCPDCGSGN